MPRRYNNKYNRSENDNELNYQKGYRDGMQDAFDKSELDAYYAGVGYGKMKAKDKHIGFNSDEERREFEKGIANKDQHFKSYRVRRSFWEKLFGIGRKEKSASAPSKSKPKKPSKKKKARTKKSGRSKKRFTRKRRR